MRSAIADVDCTPGMHPNRSVSRSRRAAWRTCWQRSNVGDDDRAARFRQRGQGIDDVLYSRVNLHRIRRIGTSIGTGARIAVHNL